MTPPLEADQQRHDELVCMGCLLRADRLTEADVEALARDPHTCPHCGWPTDGGGDEHLF